jgi:hypothetical protein
MLSLASSKTLLKPSILTDANERGRCNFAEIFSRLNALFEGGGASPG